MEIIESPAGQIVINSVLEIVMRYYGDVNFQWASALGHGLFVGGCSFVGGILGGRVGLLTGGIIGSQISNYVASTVVTLRQIISQLDATQLRNMCILLWERIQTVAYDTLNVVNLNLTTILERFGHNSAIQSATIEIISNFVSEVHGGRIRRIED